MEELKKAIETWGRGIGSDIVKVDMFLNHRIDVQLLTQMGQAFHEAFKFDPVDLILTIEASGIAAAVTTAQAFGNIPVVFAKKGETTNVGKDVYVSRVYSFTHRQENVIRVSREYLKPGQRVLIIDDFLANGEAVDGLRDIVNQAGCVLTGVGICIEKGFQPGGNHLRELGIKVKSLAIVDAIANGIIQVRDGD
jgi:xanthine phosphoribosyltransferase